MDKNDLKQIREEFGSVIEDNLMPMFDELKSEIGEIKSQMVTKVYLDDKLADLEGVTVVRQRKEDQKVNLLIEMLKEKGTLTDEQTNQLKGIKVFPA